MEYNYQSQFYRKQSQSRSSNMQTDGHKTTNGFQSNVLIFKISLTLRISLTNSINMGLGWLCILSTTSISEEKSISDSYA